MQDRKDDKIKSAKETRPLAEGVDYYFEDGLMVLTRRFLLDRGFCCGNGCRHCPYDDEGRPVSE